MFTKMTGEGLRPDRVTYTTLIKGFGRSGEAARAVELLHVLQQSNLGADAKAYQATAHACLSCRNVTLAHEVVTEMIDAGEMSAP